MIALFAMPDDPAKIPGWLTAHLLGPELPAVVAELRAAHRPGSSPGLDAVLGDHRAAFLAGGFAALPRPVLSNLLRNPDLLLALPDLVCAEGGRVWFAGPLDPAEVARAARVADRVHAATLVRPRRPSGWWKYAAVSLATAAAMLAAVYLGGGFRGPVAPAWGLAKVKEVPRDAGPKAVFTKLAEFADEWHKKQPTDAAGLAKRLHEFRQGCTALQLADDLPLSTDDRVWLTGMCGEWAGQIDRHLRDLERTRDVSAVATAMKATASGMADDLRQRAG